MQGEAERRSRGRGSEMEKKRKESAAEWVFESNEGQSNQEAEVTWGTGPRLSRTLSGNKSSDELLR